jgi:hypothetical protein
VAATPDYFKRHRGLLASVFRRGLRIIYAGAGLVPRLRPTLGNAAMASTMVMSTCHIPYDGGVLFTFPFYFSASGVV